MAHDILKNVLWFCWKSKWIRHLPNPSNPEVGRQIKIHIVNFFQANTLTLDCDGPDSCPTASWRRHVTKSEIHRAKERGQDVLEAMELANIDCLEEIASPSKSRVEERMNDGI